MPFIKTGDGKSLGVVKTSIETVVPNDGKDTNIIKTPQAKPADG